MRTIRWYFDVISPYAYFSLHRLRELPADVAVEYKPVLFAGLLGTWGQKGPAEIPGKRRWTYQSCQWWADSHGIPFRFPARHPFNPLAHLRLIIACGTTPAAVQAVFEAIWTTGVDVADAAAFETLARRLGIDDPDALAAPAVKDILRRDTDEAVSLGVFGVPTFAIDGELFWGNDSMDFLRTWLADPTVLQTAEMQRLAALPVGASRRE